ncbi:hypothetical protein KY285_011689 [Solanum tuberosum]|nr:hypothetical protein KY285_011689 [Solanum tuberosum]
MFVLGFDFAIKTRDYKVVRMAYAHDDGQYLLPPRVEIYALSSGIWKGFDGFIPDICVVEYFWTQVEICGKVHWTAYKRNGERRVENLIVISCSIWEMKRYVDTDSWSKEYNVALGQGSLGMVLAVTDCRKILLTDTMRMLAKYNPEMETKESINIADKGELLPPVDLSYEKSIDDNDDDDDDTQISELLKYHFMHQRVKAFLGAKNNNEQML